MRPWSQSGYHGDPNDQLVAWEAFAFRLSSSPALSGQLAQSDVAPLHHRHTEPEDWIPKCAPIPKPAYRGSVKTMLKVWRCNSLPDSTL